MHSAWSGGWRSLLGDISRSRFSNIPRPGTFFPAPERKPQCQPNFARDIQCFSIASRPFRRRISQQLPTANVPCLRCPGGLHSRPPRPWKSSSILSHPYSSQRKQDPLPDNYDPNEGVRFQEKDLSANQIVKIFGTALDPGFGNLILRIQHGRRLAGTLETTALSFPESTNYSNRMADKALDWLRTNYPIDEEAAALLRAERDATQLGATLDVYKPQQGIPGDERYGKSGLDEIREFHEKKIAEREKAQQPAATTEPVVGLPVQPAWQAGSLTRKEAPEWVKRGRERAMLTTSTEPPKLSKWQLLGPSTLITLAVVTLAVLFANTYIPPTQSLRLWPDLPPAAATVLSLIAINATMFLIWRLPFAYRFMNKYFLAVPSYPYAFSVIGNTFSHQRPLHLATNMVVLWLVGTKLHDDVGRGTFLGIYFSGAVLSSYASLLFHVMTKSVNITALGASGAIASIIAAWLNLNSHEKFTFIFLPPDLLALPANTMLSLFIGGEIICILLGYRKLDHWAHLGGLLSGLASAQALKYRARRRKSEEDQKSQKNWVTRAVRGR